MHLPAIQSAFRQAAETVRRFPLSLLSAAVATAALLPDPPDWSFRLWATGLVGLSGLTAITVASERARLSAVRQWLSGLLVVGGLAVLFAVSRRWPDAAAALHFLQLLLLTHLLVSVLPYYRPGPLGGFWQYNRALFSRFVLAAVYAVVLGIGLSVALAALKELLHVPVTDRAYRYLWAILAFTFHPWFVLAGVPRDHDALERDDDYPRAIKVFTQFVLIPLVTVYLVILLSYLARVTVTRTWPSGWIGYLVSSVSAVGVLALLLVHPIRDRADSRWVNAYGRWFFVALLLPLVMLLMAVGKRIGQYGVTEPRYFLLALAVWMLALALFYGLTGSRNIKLIPMTLAGVTLFTAGGPWGAYQVSRQSQLARLSDVVVANGMGRLGAITRPPHDVSVADREALSAEFDYLDSHHRKEVLAAALGISVERVQGFATDSAGRMTSMADGAMRSLGLRFTRRGWRGTDGYFSAHTPPHSVVDITGYDQLWPINLSANTTLWLGPDSIAVTSDSLRGAITITRRGKDRVILDIAGTLVQRGTLLHLGGADDMTLEAPIIVEGGPGGLDIRLVIESVRGRNAADRPTLTNLSGYLLLRSH